MAQVVERGNVTAAVTRGRQNKGRPGVDGRTVDARPTPLVEHGETIRAQVLAGTYQPEPVRKGEIPKSGGGVRTRGMPSVRDRVIQQSLMPGLQPRFAPTVSEPSPGFRPGRHAHHAVGVAQRDIQEGKRGVGDVDLETFFDRVHHAVRRGRLATRMGDKRIRGLIRVATWRLAAGPTGW
jgi:RNA-directed DNA polymerase